MGCERTHGERRFRRSLAEDKRGMKSMHPDTESVPPPAMVNEVLAKIVCNNLCCVILSQCELGIEAEFWQDKVASEERPSILPLVRPG